MVKYISIYLLSSVKFFGGLLLGTTSKISFWETGLVSAAGAVSMVGLIMAFASLNRKKLDMFLAKTKSLYYRSLLKTSMIFLSASRYQIYETRIINKQKPKKFSKTTRMVVKAWKGFGPSGVAFLTPLILSPIGGAIVAISFRAKFKKTMLYMIIFHLFFGLLFAFLLSEFGHLIERVLGISLGVQG